MKKALIALAVPVALLASTGAFACNRDCATQRAALTTHRSIATR
ncbi:hypothetical protein [Burkholderia cepacia]|nr:hypothetical protein [Burkholderia cepacia]